MIPLPAACPVCESAAPVEFATVSGAAYLRCPDCAAVFLEPLRLPDPASERARYLRHENSPEDAGYVAFLNRLAAPLLSRLPRRPCDGLDYGSGPAPDPVLPRLLRGAGHRVALYDPFFRPDAGVFSESFDFIVACETAEHFHRPAFEFARLAGMLRAGGLLAVMTASPPDTPAAFSGWHYRSDPTHVVFYARRTFETLAARLGLRVEFPAADVAILARGCA